MEKLTKLLLPVTIIIASLILGGFFYASQVNKQRSIERQQQIKIEQEKQAKIKSIIGLDFCLNNAEDSYRALVKLNTDKGGDYRSIEAQKFVENKYISEKNDCFKQYPQK